MTAQATPATMSDLSDVRAQFDALRSTKAGGGRIPDRLWSLAIARLSSHSATEVALQLGLRPERLRRRRAEMTRTDRTLRKPRAPRTRCPSVPALASVEERDGEGNSTNRTSGEPANTGASDASRRTRSCEDLRGLIRRTTFSSGLQESRISGF